jgi:hypothetical protein
MFLLKWKLNNYTLEPLRFSMLYYATVYGEIFNCQVVYTDALGSHEGDYENDCLMRHETICIYCKCPHFGRICFAYLHVEEHTYGYWKQEVEEFSEVFLSF